MFESSLFESATLAPRRRWTTGVSFAAQMLLLGLAVLAPLLYTEALPKHALATLIEAPPPPPAAPAPRAPNVASHASSSRSELNEGKVMLPRVIPKAVREIHDEPEGPPSGSGVVGAPPGAVTNGVPNAVIADMLHGLPPAIPKSTTTKTVRVSSGVAEGLLLHEVRPRYPALARSARVQGTVMLQATIGRDGTIQNLHLLSGHPLLVQAAMDAVRQWRYRPYLLNNEPVEVDTTIQVNFTLAK